MWRRPIVQLNCFGWWVSHFAMPALRMNFSFCLTNLSNAITSFRSFAMKNISWKVKKFIRRLHIGIVRRSDQNRANSHRTRYRSDRSPPVETASAPQDLSRPIKRLCQTFTMPFQRPISHRTIIYLRIANNSTAHRNANGNKVILKVVSFQELLDAKWVYDVAVIRYTGCNATGSQLRIRCCNDWSISCRVLCIWCISDGRDRRHIAGCICSSCMLWHS